MPQFETPPRLSKQWFWCCRIMTAENVINQASRLGCTSVWSTVQSICQFAFCMFMQEKMFLRNCVNAPPVCVQVERFHPSPGSVWCRRSIYCQNPGLLLSVPLLLQPAVPGSNIKTTQNKTNRVFLHVDFIQYVWLLIIHQIVSNIGEEMGTIWKKWPGFNDEHNMDHEYFGLEGEFKEMWFPIPHEVVPKVLLSCYLVEANTKVKLIKIKLLRTWWTCMALFTHLSRHVLLRKWDKRVKLNLDNLTII